MAIKVGDRVRETRRTPPFADTGVVTALRKKDPHWKVPVASVTWRVHAPSMVRQSDLEVLEVGTKAYKELDSLAALVRGIVCPLTAYSVLRLCGHREDHTRLSLTRAVSLTRSECAECREFEID